MKVSGFAAALCCAVAEQQSALAWLTVGRIRTEEGQVGHGVLERRNFEVGLPVVIARDDWPVSFIQSSSETPALAKTELNRCQGADRVLSSRSQLPVQDRDEDLLAVLVWSKTHAASR